MYELAIEHHRSGLSQSVHVDRDAAVQSLSSYGETIDSFPHSIQLTEPFSSYEFIDQADGRALAVATIQHQPAELVTETALPQPQSCTTPHHLGPAPAPIA